MTKSGTLHIGVDGWKWADWNRTTRSKMMASEEYILSLKWTYKSFSLSECFVAKSNGLTTSSSLSISRSIFTYSNGLSIIYCCDHSVVFYTTLLNFTSILSILKFAVVFNLTAFEHLFLKKWDRCPVCWNLTLFACYMGRTPPNQSLAG